MYYCRNVNHWPLGIYDLCSRYTVSFLECSQMKYNSLDICECIHETYHGKILWTCRTRIHDSLNTPRVDRRSRKRLSQALPGGIHIKPALDPSALPHSQWCENHSSGHGEDRKKEQMSQMSQMSPPLDITGWEKFLPQRCVVGPSDVSWSIVKRRASRSFSPWLIK